MNDRLRPRLGDRRQHLPPVPQSRAIGPLGQPIIFVPNNTSEFSPTVTIVAPGVDVTISKSDSPDPVTAGNNLTYTIIVSNAGSSAAQSVSLSDAIPVPVPLLVPVVEAEAGDRAVDRVGACVVRPDA